jgi:L-ascorbate metabolism protein UlaG (beta-lactamase superfamily)
MKLTWLLQGGFLFEIASQRIVVDAYLSDIVEVREKLTRLSKSPISLEALRPNVWICTHDHLDHFDPPTIEKAAAMYPKCCFVGPPSVCQHLRELGIDAKRIIPLAKGNSTNISGNISIKAVPAYHSDPEAIGLIVESEQKRIYLSGDTLWTDDLRQEVRDFGALDLILICINGKLGNMNTDEAIELVQILHPKLAIPMHYGLFAENTADPKYFVEACQKSGISSLALEPGREYAL